MKERPILFSGPMVRAILDGRKTMTRRVMKTQPAHGCYWAMNCNGDKALHLAKDETQPGGLSFVLHDVKDCVRVVQGKKPKGDHRYPCPYGGPGDRLIVRETWSPDHAALYPHYPIVYRADGYPHDSDIENGTIESPESGGNRFPFKWRPSIHMPHAHSRITLEITGVKVERLQDITPEEAIAEGCCPRRDNEWDKPEVYRKAAEIVGGPYPRGVFAMLWEQINGKTCPWSLNPWVWAITFKRV